MAKDDYSNWLEEDQYKKAIFHFRSQARDLLERTYSMHGYKELAPMVANQFVELAEQFGMVVRGRDVPISIRNVRE